MKKCKNGCCRFADSCKDEDIYCASRAPEGYENTPEQQKMIDDFVEKQLNLTAEGRK